MITFRGGPFDGISFDWATQKPGEPILVMTDDSNALHDYVVLEDGVTAQHVKTTEDVAPAKEET